MKFPNLLDDEEPTTRDESFHHDMFEYVTQVYPTTDDGPVSMVKHLETQVTDSFNSKPRGLRPPLRYKIKYFDKIESLERENAILKTIIKGIKETIDE